VQFRNLKREENSEYKREISPWRLKELGWRSSPKPKRSALNWSTYLFVDERYIME